MMKSILIIFVLLFGKLGMTCTCDWTPYFKLDEYDKSKHIIEVKFVEEIFFDSTSIVEKKKGDGPPEIPSLLEFGLARRYKIEIIEQYKGDFITKDSVVDVSDDSSCSHQPKLGQTYIVYLYDDFFDFEACQTIILKGSERYKSEKEILTFLKLKKGTLHQVQLGELIIEGQFKHKKRVGKWMIYFPDSDEDLITIELTYQRGILINIESSLEIDKLKHKTFPNYAYEYYKYFSQKG